MALAGFGIEIEERTLEAAARMEEDGTAIDELERLARQFPLEAEIQETTVEELGRILAAGKVWRGKRPIAERQEDDSEADDRLPQDGHGTSANTLRPLHTNTDC